MELRRHSANFLTASGFDGYAIGGLSIGEPKQITNSIVEETVSLLPEYKPRYLMGVGSPEDILEGVGRSADQADILQDARDKGVADELFGLAP